MGAHSKRSANAQETVKLRDNVAVTSSRGQPPHASEDTGLVAEPPAAPENPSQIVIPDPPGTPRWLIVLAWSTGPMGLYVLLSLTQAAFVERILSVDVGFGRGLAFWVGSIYLALMGWGFLPSRPTGWYARRRTVLAALAVGVVGIAVCSAYTVLWLMAHWITAVGLPVTGSIVVLLAAGKSLGIPAEGIALLMGVDFLADMARTAVNVFGNSLAAAVMDRGGKRKTEVEPAA